MVTSTDRTVRMRKRSPLFGGGVTHRGNLRQLNEDVIVDEPVLGLYAVLDGMGGMPGGAQAAEIAGNAIASYVRRWPEPTYPEQQLAVALSFASEAVYEAARQRPELTGMGTTAVVCLADQQNTWIGHAGDSRAYLLHEGELLQLTHDHTVVQELVSSGEYTLEEVSTFCSSSMLTRNLGHEPHVVSTVVQLQLVPGNVLLLSSDGLHNEVPREQLVELLQLPLPPTAIAQRLIDAALTGRCHDNVSAMVLRYDW